MFKHEHIHTRCFCCWCSSCPQPAVPSQKFTSLVLHCSPMLARFRNEVFGVDYICFSCRWQVLCCLILNSKCANSWWFQLHHPAYVWVMAPPLGNSLHLLALILSEKLSSYLPFCKPSTPYLAKHFWDVFLRLTCSNKALNKYADGKGHLRIIFKTWLWTGWKVLTLAHLHERLLAHVSSGPYSQISDFCVGFLPQGKCFDPLLALKPLTHNLYLFLKSYMWSLPWEVSQLRSM